MICRVKNLESHYKQYFNPTFIIAFYVIIDEFVRYIRAEKDVNLGILKHDTMNNRRILIES